MKKTVRKLVVNKETLRGLEIRQAQSGISNHTCDVSGCIECGDTYDVCPTW